MVNSFTDWEGTCLAHHGIKGQKWGVRRYQNEDGTLTTLGKLRGGKEARQENRTLKKALADNKRYSKEWRKERKKATKKASKDDNYRKNIAEMEARRLNLDPEGEKEWMDARDVGSRVADMTMWYRHGDRQYKNIVTKIDSSEKIAKSVLKKLNERGVSVSKNGRRWQSQLEKERGQKRSGRNAFKGKSARSTLSLMQSQREIEKERKRKNRKESIKRGFNAAKSVLDTAYTAKKLIAGG